MDHVMPSTLTLILRFFRSRLCCIHRHRTHFIGNFQDGFPLLCLPRREKSRHKEALVICLQTKSRWRCRLSLAAWGHLKFNAADTVRDLVVEPTKESRAYEARDGVKDRKKYK